MSPLALGVWALFVLAIAAGPRLVDEAAVRAALVGLGPLAPLAALLAEAAQVIVIPIPGQPIEIAAGWALGLAAGALVASVGAVLGSVAAFRLGRRYGRPWVERHVAGDTRERFFARWSEERRAGWIVFWLMLVPAFPRDPLCYLAGVTGLSMRRFTLIAAVGRPIGLVPWVALGADGVAAGVRLQIAMLAAAGLVWLGHALFTRLQGAAAPEPTES